MNLYFNKWCSIFAKMEILRKNANQIEKLIFILHVFDCGFKKFESIDEKELRSLMKILI